MDSFTPTEGDTLDRLLDRFDTTRNRYLEVIAGQDPDEVITAPSQPWDDRPDPAQSSQRVMLVHQVEEFARHAGHADIIREELDGATAMPLRFAVEGRPGNPFVQPWTPQD